jgi:hypothetical protein
MSNSNGWLPVRRENQISMARRWHEILERKKERFDVAAEDSGKAAYCCVRYENAKGKAGP